MHRATGCNRAAIHALSLWVSDYSRAEIESVHVIGAASQLKLCLSVLSEA